MKNNNDMSQLLELSDKDFKSSHDKNASTLTQVKQINRKPQQRKSQQRHTI